MAATESPWSAPKVDEPGPRSPARWQVLVGRGRMGRIRFLTANLLIWTAALALDSIVSVQPELALGVVVGMIWVRVVIEMQRWHDLGRSGAWVLPSLLLTAFGQVDPTGQGAGFLGLYGLVSIVLLLLPGTRGRNEYGETPP